MFFAPSAPLTGLIVWCRAFRHGLSAGLSLPRVFRQQANKGPKSMREIAGRVADRMESGTSLEESLEPERAAFPPMFFDMVGIGERTGHLPEIFRSLTEYYEVQLSMRRKFIREITWPVFQFVAAVGVIAMLIMILGIIGESNGSPPIEPIGMGLSGTSGAITFVVAVVLVIGLMWGGYVFFTRGVRQRAKVEALLLKIPAVGPCLDALAMQRFCIGMQMTMEAGIPIEQATKRSLRATGNAAFMACEKQIVQNVRAGRDLTSTLTRCGVFKEEFLHIMQTAEESGQIPEVMAQQAEFYREEADRKLSGLTKAASFGVWLFVAILIIIAIFRIFSVYIGAINAIG